MKNRITKCVAMLAILCVLVTSLAVSALAASYSKVYGQTQDKVRVRASASTSATITDNIIKGACVYVTDSKTSGSMTFVKVRYRNSDGDISTGWICQSDSDDTFVKILSADQASKTFGVKSGNLPSKKVGTFTSSQRAAGTSSGSVTTVSEHNSKETVKSVQRMLAALGYYNGEITGNVGAKTEAAIEAFQKAYSLSVDGVAGPATISKLQSVYNGKGGSSSGSASGSVLKLGSTGTAVRELQKDLEALGYYWADITGNFGSKTEAAVKLFQQRNNLTADGAAGSKTLAAIDAALSRSGISSSAGYDSNTIIKLNSKGDAVTKLQTDLKQLGYYTGSITGNAGSKTVAAIKDFQEDYGLSADGIAGPSTLAKIQERVKAAGGSVSSGSGLKLGSTGASVSELQTNLTTLGYYYGDITGHYGSLTQTAVKRFQKSRGLTQDGVAGTKTLNAIANALGSSGSGSVSGVISSGSALREGDKSDAVRELQEMLHSLGYYYGDITGRFGSLTKSAVRKFQDDNDLTVDGIAGVKTINKLRALTGTSSDSIGSGSAGSTVSTANSYGRTIKDNVYLRASYSTTSASKASLDLGDKFRISKVYTVGDYKWYYITVQSGGYTHVGYVRGDMIEIITAEEYGSGADNSASGDYETIGMIVVTGNNVSIRTEPSTSADKVGTANKGDVFYFIDSVSGWYRIKSGYWIHKDYADTIDDDEIDDYIGDVSTSGTYKLNDTGATVGYIQTMLKKLKYYSGSISNHFGTLTKQAVMDFQKDHGLSRDGVVGAKTMAALVKAYEAAGSGSGGSAGDVELDSTDVVYDMDWFKAQSNRVFSQIGLVNKGKAKLTDLQSGRTLDVYIQSTGYHADVEPLTASDTSTLCKIYGVSSASKISWVARPMMLTTSKGHRIVCSIYGEPHGAEDIDDNNYDGQFCLHFSGSKTHVGSEVLDRHKTAIANAIKYVEAKGATVKKLDDQGDL